MPRQRVRVCDLSRKICGRGNHISGRCRSLVLSHHRNTSGSDVNRVYRGPIALATWKGNKRRAIARVSKSPERGGVRPAIFLLNEKPRDVNEGAHLWAIKWRSRRDSNPRPPT